MNQVAVVTGAGRGIGLAVVRRLAAAGVATIVMLDRDADALEAARAGLAGCGATLEAHAVDVTDEAPVRAAIEGTAERHGRIDVLVNNAGVYPHIPFADTTLEEFRRIVSVNLDGTFLCSHASFPHMRAQGYGRIVNIATDAFFNGFENLSAYVAAKGGVIGLTRTLAAAGGAHGITVNAVAPGLIASDGALRDIEPLFDVVVGQAQVVKRRGEPADVAEAVAYFASPAAGFVTGQTLMVNGGGTYS